MADFNIENLRFNKNEEKMPIQISWCAATTKNFIDATDWNKVSMQEVNSVNIVALCDEILNILYTNTKSRSSLYLTSQIVYGTLRVFQAQAQSTLDTCQNVFSELFTFLEIKNGQTKNKKSRNKLETDQISNPEIPEIPEINIDDQLGGKALLEDHNLMQEVDTTITYQMEGLSFQCSNYNDGCGASQIEKELADELQQILRHQESDIPYSDVPTTPPNTLLREKSPTIANTPSHLHRPYNKNDEVEVIRDQDPMKKSMTIDSGMQRKRLKTPSKKARSKLTQQNQLPFSPAERERNLVLPVLTRDSPTNQDSLFLTMSPILATKRKRPVELSQNFTIAEPHTDAALPTDSPLRSQLPMEWATPPQLFSSTVDERCVSKSPLMVNEQLRDHKSHSENQEIIINTAVDNNDESTVKEKSHIDNNPKRRKPKKRIFQEKITQLDNNVFDKKINYLTMKKRKIITPATHNLQLTTDGLFNLMSRKKNNIANHLMQLYKSNIQNHNNLLVKKPTVQHFKNQNREVEEVHCQTPHEMIEENIIESQQNNLNLEGDIMLPETQPEVNINDRQYIDGNEYNNTLVTDISSPYELSQKITNHTESAHTELVDEGSVTNINQINTNLFQEAKRLQTDKIDTRLDTLAQSTGINDLLSPFDFYVRIQELWHNDNRKLNKMKNKNNLITTFYEVIGLQYTNEHIIIYLMYCFELEQKKMINLEQKIPYSCLYIIKQSK